MRGPSAACLAAAVTMIVSSGCWHAGGGAGGADPTTIRTEGSDTMVNLAQAWAEKYHQQHPDVSVQVLGGGSGVGIASLIDGNCDMANTSRRMKPEEIERVRARRGAKPLEHIVGYDAMGIYVHPKNPIENISIEELAEIFGDEGTIHRWSALGVTMPPRVPDKIIRVSRQNSSGTYSYFREHVLGKKRDMGLGALEANGSKDAVALVSRTPCAIGCSGMGYATPDVKMLSVSRKKGEPGIEPTLRNAKTDKYPITRPLLIYTVGEPTGPLKEFLAWILSPSGQETVTQLGYVPVGEHE
jgi:phosphate transport system substrate-binding protein